MSAALYARVATSDQDHAMQLAGWVDDDDEDPQDTYYDDPEAERDRIHDLAEDDGLDFYELDDIKACPCSNVIRALCNQGAPCACSCHDAVDAELAELDAAEAAAERRFAEMSKLYALEQEG